MSTTKIVAFTSFDVFGNHAYWGDKNDWSAGVPDGGTDALVGPLVGTNSDGILNTIPYSLDILAGEAAQARSLTLSGQSLSVDAGASLKLSAGLKIVPQKAPVDVGGTQQYQWLAPSMLVGGVLEVAGGIVNKPLLPTPIVGLAFTTDGSAETQLRIDGGTVLSGSGYVSLNGYGANGAEYGSAAGVNGP